MKKLSKAILLAVGAVLVLALFGLFCVNLYIQSPRTQEQIQEQLSRTLRMPLKITNTSLSPWSGLRITGITIPHGDTNFLEAGSFVASYRALPLLAGRLSIPEMRVDKPKIIWRQNAEGRWKLPSLEEVEAVVAAEESKTVKSAPKEKKAKSGFTVVLGRFVVKDGSIDLVDKDGIHTAVFTDVNLTYTTLSEQLAEGTATIGRIVWAETLLLENVRTPFKYTNGEFTLPELTATFGGGPVRGSFRAQPNAPKAPFETAVAFDQVHLDRLITDVGGKTGRASGIAAGKLSLRGDLNRAERAEGTGEIQLRDGRFQQLELFQTIGQALNIRELSDLRLKDANGEFRIGGEKVFVDQLTLNAANLQLSAKGQIRFDRKVTLESRLGVDEALVKQLPDLVRESFATADTGQRTIDFNITGSTDRLRTNLLDKLIGQKIGQQFDDLLTGLFGGSKKDDDKKKKEEEERKKAEKKKKKDQAAALKAGGAAAPAPPAEKGADPTTAITPVKP